MQDVDTSSSLHGTQPQNLIEKIIRLKIWDCAYWKEHCFALTAETLVDRAVVLNHIGACYGGSRKPCDFLCLLLKMLQISPERGIVLELLTNDEFKYVRILAAVYLRFTASPLDVYNYLEPLLNDFRKIRVLQTDGSYMISHVDEIVDSLLMETDIWSMTLPRLPKRQHLEEAGKIDPRISALTDLDELQLSDQEEDAKLGDHSSSSIPNEYVEPSIPALDNSKALSQRRNRESRSRSPRSRSRSRHRDSRCHRQRSRSRDSQRRRRSTDRCRRKSRSRSRGTMRPRSHSSYRRRR